MSDKLDELLTEILRLPSWERQRLLDRVEAAEPPGVRETAGTYTYQSDSMRFVTVALPDDLARKAQEAGLLGHRALEGILRRALEAHALSDDSGVSPRRLVEKNGYLVAEAAPDERRITTAEVRGILDDMEW